ncbi:MAG: aminopeptidase [Lachnospiraceae bacterium]|nr:aminopeptidase [Lachnospiraceae bacterium]
MNNERYTLSTERIAEIANEYIPDMAFKDYFKELAEFMTLIQLTLKMAENEELCKLDMEAAKKLNQRLYKDILPENYENSYGNPDHMFRLTEKEKCDPKLGQYLCFLYSELRGLIPCAFEKRVEIITIYQELFIEIYNIFSYAFMDEKQPDPLQVHDALYWFQRDNLDILMEDRILDQISYKRDFAFNIIKKADLKDQRYLYDFGEYISDNEIEISKFLSLQKKEDIEAMARTFTEGYRVGFVKSGKDLNKKTSVNIRYNLGFELIIREAIKQFEDMGLHTILYRNPSFTVNKNGYNRTGYYGAVPNRQYDYDHREDNALFLDQEFIQRKLDVMKSVYEDNKELAAGFAGPAVMETFGEEPFDPESSDNSLRLSEKQRKLSVDYTDKAGRLTNNYIKREERSFTIIAYPVPEIGKDFEAIFRETIKVNTLDYKKYEKMQQLIIDVLDKAERVHILGRKDAGNETDMTVELFKLGDPLKESIFENCVADVNIPLGEVFTSPLLEGTRGLLHVSQVYLNELLFKDLRIRFEDGMIVDYSCGNFDNEEENRKYIEENILYNHKTLPLGEFAIGTNTYAYRMSRDYDIGRKLPILIGEKTGPHFAVGDTCYSHEEDVRVFNPDGKEIVAKYNSVSEKRKEKPEEAYFYCHTDITIPYHELGLITAINAKGEGTDIIKDGLFVLDGLSELNVPLLS